jgi:hypothetical protein
MRLLAAIKTITAMSNADRNEVSAMAALIRRKQRVAEDPEQVFGPVALRQLRDLLGAAADRLIPLFAVAAMKYRKLERETHAAGMKRRSAARSHAVVGERLQGLTGRVRHSSVAADWRPSSRACVRPSAGIQPTGWTLARRRGSVEAPPFCCVRGAP